jgi:hypothetical protein
MRDRALIAEGPEPRRRTVKDYTGRRVDRDRRAYKQAYRRVWREAMRDARGALIDLAFLAEHADPDWLYDLVTDNTPLYELTDDDVESKTAREQINAMGYPHAPLESLLRNLAGRVGWEKWPVLVNAGENQPTMRERGGSFIVVRLAAALEDGLNGDAPAPTHVVQIVNREPRAPWPARAPARL